MKVIYIAGPYRDSRGEYYVRRNIRKAEEAALFVWGNGGVALCPHKNSAGFGGAYNIKDKTWLDGDLELLRRCDAIWLIEGWSNSEGAANECCFAQVNGIKILRNHGEVVKFLREE